MKIYLTIYISQQDLQANLLFLTSLFLLYLKKIKENLKFLRILKRKSNTFGNAVFEWKYMSYRINFGVSLGKSYEGLSLAAQFINYSGTDVGDEITSGFVDLGNGLYMWSYLISDGFSGAVKFYEQGSSSEILSFAVINSREIENPDIKTSSARNSINQKIDNQTIMSIDNLSGVIGLND